MTTTSLAVALDAFAEENPDEWLDEVLTACEPGWRPTVGAPITVLELTAISQDQVAALVEIEIESAEMAGGTACDRLMTSLRVWLCGSQVADVAGLVYEMAYD
jgi:hypothetical protein